MNVSSRDEEVTVGSELAREVVTILEVVRKPRWEEDVTLRRRQSHMAGSNVSEARYMKLTVTSGNA